MICFVIYGVNIYVSKHKFNSFEKNVWYSYDFGWFSWKFSMILADFLLPGSVSLKRIRIRLTKMKRIQTDPDPQHWGKGNEWSNSHDATVVVRQSNEIFVVRTCRVLLSYLKGGSSMFEYLPIEGNCGIWNSNCCHDGGGVVKKGKIFRAQVPRLFAFYLIDRGMRIQQIKWWTLYV